MLSELREARRSAGWSQRNVAERIGRDPQVIKRLEAGVGSMTTLVAVMDALNFRLTGLGRGRTLLDALRARRVKRGWSISYLAKRAGLSRKTIAAVERGESSLDSFLQVIAVLAPNVKRRAPERSYWGEGDKFDRDSRFTPTDFMELIYRIFGPVDLDPCAHPMSPVVARRRIILDEGGDGLIDPWSGDLVYMNPPYSQLLVWLRRAHEQWKLGNVKTVVCLVPVRTDSAWFQDTLAKDADCLMLRGRLKFLAPNGKAQSTPFPLMLVLLGATAEHREMCSELISGCWAKWA